MKLEINSDEKKIRLLEKVNLGELFTFLEGFLSDLKWREYSIEGNVVYNVPSPIIVNPTIPNFTPYTPIGPINPTYPTAPNYPLVTYCTSSTGEIK